MNEWDSSSWKKFQEKWLSRRNLIRGAAGTALGASLLRPKVVYGKDDGDEGEHGGCVGPNPIPGGVTGLQPFGIFIHHNPLKPANKMAVAGISDPSQITDFDGFVGLTHIRGGGTGTDATGSTRLSFQADMGFSQGKFVGADGRVHRGTLAFV